LSPSLRKSIEAMLRDVKKSFTISQLKQPTSEVESIPMKPDNVSKILSGEKTTTLRLDNLPSGIYNIGGQRFNITNRGLLSIEEAGGVETISKSEAFAKSGPKFPSTKDFLAGKRKLYVYDISPINQPITTNQTLNSKGETSIEEYFRLQEEAFAEDSEVKKGTLNVYWGGKNANKPENHPERILSNLAKRQFTYQGRKYGSVEHAYQSNKSGTFNQLTYDRYNKLRKTPGYGKKISSKVSKKQLQAANSLTLMKNLVVESFKQDPTSPAAKVLMQYKDFTHNGLENKNEIDKAFVQGLRLAKQELTGEVAENQEKNSDTPSVTEANQLSLFPKDETVRLKNGRDYKISEIDGSMLEDLGYTKKEVIEILKNIC